MSPSGNQTLQSNIPHLYMKFRENPPVREIFVSCPRDSWVLLGLCAFQSGFQPYTVMTIKKNTYIYIYIYMLVGGIPTPEKY